MGETTVSIPTRVLVFGMAHEDGTILAEEVFPVAEACGQSADQVRSCLRRLVSEGLFIRSGAGRDAIFDATPAGMAALGSSMERTRLAYIQDAAGRGWDRQWRLVAFAVPEQYRAARDAFRERLRVLGGAAIQGGLYVSPHPWHKEVRDEAERLGLLELITLVTTDELEIGGERDPRELARRLWRVDELAERYELFVKEFGSWPEMLEDRRREHLRLSDADFLPLALSMAVAFSPVFGDDPLLPPELLPRPWPGRVARDLVVRSRRLALAMRQSHNRAALFHLFDEAIESLPN